MGECTCDGVCHESAHCIAIKILDTGECWVACSQDDQVLAPSELLPLDSGVDVETRNVDLVMLGRFIDGGCEADVLIPARDAARKVDMRHEGTTLGELIDRAGLMVAGGNGSQRQRGA
jgi:hypothetical protein